MNQALRLLAEVSSVLFETPFRSSPSLRDMKGVSELPAFYRTSSATVVIVVGILERHDVGTSMANIFTFEHLVLSSTYVFEWINASSVCITT